MDAAALEALAERLKASPALAAKADIGIVAARLGLAQGAIPVGDDCAAIPDGDGHLLFAAEGFISAFVDADPWFAGWCGVMVNLSDVAAMGGRPLAVVDVVWAEGEEGAKAVLDGLRAAAGAYGVPIVGGHTNLHNRETHLAVAVLGRAGARLLTSFDAQPGDALVMVVDKRGAYREPFDNFQAALEAPPERLRADLALLPELAEKGLARAAKDISQGGVPGTAVMLAESSGVSIALDLDAIEPPPGVALERWLKTFPSFGFLLSVAPRKCRARAFAVSRARAARGFDRRRQTGKPGHAAIGGPERPSSRLWRGAADGVRREERKPHEPPASRRHADALHPSSRRRRPCDEPQRGPRRPRRPDCAARAGRHGVRLLSQAPLCGHCLSRSSPRRATPLTWSSSASTITSAGFGAPRTAASISITPMTGSAPTRLRR